MLSHLFNYRPSIRSHLFFPIYSISSVLSHLFHLIYSISSIRSHLFHLIYSISSIPSHLFFPIYSISSLDWCCSQIVLKAGHIVLADVGDANASIPTPEPRILRPMFAAKGQLAGRASIAFVSGTALYGDSNRATFSGEKESGDGVDEIE